MTPTQTFENYPEFANAGQKSQPNDAKYSAGFIPSDVLPAEWLNWFLNGATKGVTALNTGVKSIEQEINAVLESRSVTPDINAAGQLLSVLNKIKAEAVLAAHPVGSLYWTSKNENPAITFGGGTWKQITDKFVLAAGSTYKAESTGGASSVTLTVSNMPSHSHTFKPSGTITMNAHSHTVKNHSHTFSGTTTADGLHYHFINAWTSFSSGTRSDGIALDKLNAEIGAKPISPNFTHNLVNTSEYIKSGKVTIYYPNYHNGSNANYLGTSDWIDGESNGIMTVPHTYTHFNQKYTSYSGGHTHSLSGTTSSSAPTCSSVTTTGSFSGTSGTTDTSGSGTDFSIMPPYVVKYCWERTA